jgi:hypothetical protein
MSRVLIAGVPRSGTTWIARMLASTEGTTLLFEPDNHQMYPFAFKAKRALRGGYYPLPAPSADTSTYEELWRNAFGAGGSSFSATESVRRAVAHRLLRSGRDERIRRAFTSAERIAGRLRLAEALAIPERPQQLSGDLLVKSVYAPLALEWVADLVDAKVVIVLRDLRNIVSSWAELGWLASPEEDELAASDPEVHEAMRLQFGVPPLASTTSPIGRLTWLLGLYTLALEGAARRHPDWHVVRHEEIASHLPHSLQALAGELGLRWTEKAETAIAAATRPGRGFEIGRLPETLRDAWRKRLTQEQIAEVDAVLATFPLGIR